MANKMALGSSKPILYRGQNPALENPYSGRDDRRKMLEMGPGIETLHVWRRNFKENPRELRIMKKNHVSQDYL